MLVPTIYMVGQYLPIGNYKWEYTDDFFKDPVKSSFKIVILRNKKMLHVLLCKVNHACFPSETHNYLSDLPQYSSSGEHQGKQQSIQSKTRTTVKKIKQGLRSKVEKLVTHLNPRDGYVLHYRELQYYVSSILVYP